MKKSLLKITTILCALVFLFAVLPIAASGVGGAPVKVKATDLQAMNFMQLTNRGGMPPQFQDTGYNTLAYSIVLEGKKVATGVGSNDDAWDFTLYVYFNEEIYRTGIEPIFQYTPTSVTQEIVKGTEKGVLLFWTGDPDDEDPERQAAKKQEQKKNSLDQLNNLAGLPKGAVPPVPENIPFPQTMYLADFTITGNGYLGGATRDGWILCTVTGSRDVAEHTEPEFRGTLIYNVQLKVDDMGYATATITFTCSMGHGHQWKLEGYLGISQPQKPKKPPTPPKPPKKPDDDDLAPLDTDPDDLAPLDTEPDDLAPLVP